MWRLRLVGLMLYSLALATACGDSGSSHAEAVGASQGVSFQWSVKFNDPTLAVGSSVSGSVLTSGTGTSAPVSLTGMITSNVNGVLSLSLANDTPGTETRLVLGALNLSTGRFFGEIFSSDQVVAIEGTAALTVTGPPSGGLAPQIATVSPTSISGTNRAITITGTGFGSTQGTSTVTFATQPAFDLLTVRSWSDTQIVAVLAGWSAGSSPVYVTVGGVPSNPVTINVAEVPVQRSTTHQHAADSNVYIADWSDEPAPAPTTHQHAADVSNLGTTNVAMSETSPLFSSSCTVNDLPDIRAFIVNGVKHRVIESGPAVLTWQVRNTTGVRVRRLSGPGPDFDGTFAGGSSVTNAATLQFTSASCSGRDGCQDTLYRLTTENKCGRTEAHVAVRQVIFDRTRELNNMQTTVLQRFDGHGLPSMQDAMAGFIVPSHPAPKANPPQDQDNLCFSKNGTAYLVLIPDPFIPATIPVDIREPILVFYNPATRLLVAWAYGRLFNHDSPPSGLPVSAAQWFGHWAGWHTGDGGMLRWDLGLTAPTVPPASYCPTAIRPSCGVLPYTVIHPAFFDIHIYRDFGGGPPRVGLDTADVGFSDPCPPPRGVPFLDSNGRDLAFFLGPGQPQPGNLP